MRSADWRDGLTLELSEAVRELDRSARPRRRTLRAEQWGLAIILTGLRVGRVQGEQARPDVVRPGGPLERLAANALQLGVRVDQCSDPVLQGALAAVSQTHDGSPERVC
jgi:hypothetical protein